MARRLAALLVVACACGAAAMTVSSARANESVDAAHLPAIPAAAPVGDRCPIPQRFRDVFVDAAEDTSLPLALLTAVARLESEHAPHARRRAGENVLAGARYLKLLFERFPSTDLALAAYNTGPSAVTSAGGAPSDETLTYVADVTAIWRSLAGCR